MHRFRAAARRAGLGLRLAAVIAAIVVAAGAGAATLLHRLQAEHLLREASRGAERVAETLQKSARHAMLQNERTLIQRMVADVGRAPGVDAVRIVNKGGVVTYSSRPEEIGTRLDLEAEACVACHAAGKPIVAPDRRDRTRVFQAVDGAHRAMGLIVPAYNEPSCAGPGCHAAPDVQKVLGVVDVQVSLAEIDEAARQDRRHVLFMLLIGAPLLAVAAGIAGHILVTRPVRELADRCRDITRSGPLDLTIPLRAAGIREIEALGSAFDTMVERVAEAQEGLERKVAERTRLLRDAEAQVLRSDKLASIGVLAAGIAHEIGNPLTGVITYAHLLRRGAAPGSDAEVRLNRIISEAERCARIVQGLLDFARPSSERGRLIDVEAVVDATIQLVLPQEDFREVRISTRLAPGLPRLSVEAGRLQQVLTNLIKNAAEAGAREIVVATRAAETPPPAVEIVVDDDGSGIPDEILPRIFDPFFTTKEVGQGAGLGLYVSFGIVRDMGGTISAENAPPHGARFVVRLPLPV